MSPLFPVRLSRRALLHAAGCGTATLLAGCGGSSSEADDALPENYAEAYRLRLRDTEGVYGEAQIVGVTTGGDLLLTTRTLVYVPEGFEATGSTFRVSRYTNRAQPGLTRREDFLATRTLPVGSYGVVEMSTSGNLYASSYLVENVSAQGASQPTSRNEVFIFAPDGAKTGSAILQTTDDFGYGGVGDFPYYALTVSPEGDFSRR